MIIAFLHLLRSSDFSRERIQKYVISFSEKLFFILCWKYSLMLLKEAFCDQMFLATTHNFLDLLIMTGFSFSFCLVKGKLVRFYEKTRVYVSLKIFSYMMLTFKEVKLIAYCVHGNCDHLINIMPKFVLKSTESHCKHLVSNANCLILIFISHL
jgi:hypothetical protein